MSFNNKVTDESQKATPFQEHIH